MTTATAASRFSRRSRSEQSKDARADERVRIMDATGAIDLITQTGEGFRCEVCGEKNYNGHITVAEFAKSIFGTGTLRKVGPGRYAVIPVRPVAPQRPASGSVWTPEAIARKGKPSSWAAYEHGTGQDTSLDHYGHQA